MSGKKIKKRKSAFSIFHQPTHTQKAPYLHETHNAWATGAEKKKKARTERAPIEEIAFCDDTPACHGGKQRYKFEKKPEKKKLKGA